MKRYSTNLNFLLSDEELLPLEKAANDRRVSKGHVIRELIRENLVHSTNALQLQAQTGQRQYIG